jgi:phosphohistidine phosphatase SixA
MKKPTLAGMAAVALIAAPLLSSSLAAQEPDTVIYLVRHAETRFPPYAESPPNPYLNEVGLARADELADELGTAGLDHVFSTEYNRTWSTALPVAHAAGLEVEAYDPRDLAGFAAQLHTLRGSILVVGHSNTTPMLVEALGGEPGEPIDEKVEFNRFYTLTISGGEVSTAARHYGQPLPERMLVEGATTRDAALIGATGSFSFYSSFWANLQDTLYWQADPQRNAPIATACIESLSAQHRDDWNWAAQAYANNMAERNPRTDPLMREMRFYMAGLADAPLAGNAAEFMGVLRKAAPAYQLCMWADHDARNRAWTAELLDLLTAHQEEITARLTSLYADAWPQSIPVDVMGYANWAGANTTGNPLHMALSSADPGLATPNNLEIVFHEGSHGVFGNWGVTYEALEAAFTPRGLDPSRNVWHAVMFFTTGHVTRDALRAADYPDYVPYMVQGGVYDDLYPLLLQAWQPYLDGEINMTTAAERLAEAVAAR